MGVDVSHVDYSFQQYLYDSFERARTLNESYGMALLLTLGTVRPDLRKHIPFGSEGLKGYNPQNWNNFLCFLSEHWNG